MERKALIPQIEIEPESEPKVFYDRVIIDDLISMEGATSIVYKSTINNKPFVIKELFPEREGVFRDGETHVSGIKEFEIEQFLDQVRINDEMREYFPDKTEGKDSGKLVSAYINDMTAFKANGTAYIVVEADAQDTLKGIITNKKGKGGREELADIIEIVKRTMLPISRIHNNGYIHGDIKPSNIIKAESLFKPIDFGSAINVLKIKEKKNDEYIVPLYDCQITASINSYSGSKYCPDKWISIKEEFSRVPDNQTRDSIYNVGFYVDVYGIAMILSEMILGKKYYEFADNDQERYDAAGDLEERWGVSKSEVRFLYYLFEQSINIEHNNKPINIWQFWVLIRLFEELMARNNRKTPITREELKRDTIKDSDIGIPTSEINNWSWDEDKLIEEYIDTFNAMLIRAKSEDYYNNNKYGEGALFDRSYYTKISSKNQVNVDLPLSGKVYSDNEDNHLSSDDVFSYLINNLDTDYLIQGEGGSGKSTLISKIYEALLKEVDYIPLYLNLETLKYVENKDSEYILGGIEENLSIVLEIPEYEPDNIEDLYIEEKNLVNSTNKYILLLDNLHNLESKIEGPVVAELLDLMILSNVRTAIFTRGRIDEKYGMIESRIEIEGINQELFNAEYNVHLPKNSLFRYPLFAFMYYEISLETPERQDNYDEYAFVKIMNDYLTLMCKGNLEHADSNLGPSQQQIMHEIVSDMLPRIAFNRIVKKKDIDNLEFMIPKKLIRRFGDHIKKIIENLVVNRWALLTCIGGRWEYTHDAYAEYFCAFYICENLVRLIDKNEDEYFRLQSGQSINIYWTNSRIYSVVRDMFNSDILHFVRGRSIDIVLDEFRKEYESDENLLNSCVYLPYNIIRTFYFTLEDYIRNFMLAKLLIHDNRMKEWRWELEYIINEASNLGRIHIKNYFLDLKRTIEWSETGVRAGDNQGSRNIRGCCGNILYDGRSKYDDLLVACDNGYALAYRNYGNILIDEYYNHGKNSDLLAARDIFKKACEIGDAPAVIDLFYLFCTEKEWNKERYGEDNGFAIVDDVLTKIIRRNDFPLLLDSVFYDKKIINTLDPERKYVAERGVDSIILILDAYRINYINNIELNYDNMVRIMEELYKYSFLNEILSPEQCYTLALIANYFNGDQWTIKWISKGMDSLKEVDNNKIKGDLYCLYGFIKEKKGQRPIDSYFAAFFSYGNAQAGYFLGKAFYEGRWVERDDDQAVYILQEARRNATKEEEEVIDDLIKNIMTEKGEL